MVALWILLNRKDHQRGTPPLSKDTARPVPLQRHLRKVFTTEETSIVQLPPSRRPSLVHPPRLQPPGHHHRGHPTQRQPPLNQTRESLPNDGPVNSHRAWGIEKYWSNHDRCAVDYCARLDSWARTVGLTEFPVPPFDELSTRLLQRCWYWKVLGRMEKHVWRACRSPINDESDSWQPDRKEYGEGVGNEGVAPRFGRRAAAFVAGPSETFIKTPTPRRHEIINSRRHAIQKLQGENVEILPRLQEPKQRRRTQRPRLHHQHETQTTKRWHQSNSGR